jgi:3-oxosteroid 1-dehydrogenase
MSPVPKDALGAKPDLRVTRTNDLADRLEVDVVVVGAGAAGLAAANAAAGEGLEVLVVDGGAQPGGTTVKSSGGVLVTNNRFHRAAGIVEDRAATLRMMARTSYPDVYDAGAEGYGLDPRDLELIETFYDSSSPVFEALEDDGVLTLAPQNGLTGDPRGFPSYWTDLDDETIAYGRTLTTRTADGMEGYGRELISQLLAGAERKGARVLPQHRVSEILTDGDVVVGVECDSPEGTRTLLARRGVVFATGGFTHNRELMDAHMPGFVPGGGAAAVSRGDFVSLTTDLDVDLHNMDKAWWGEVPVEVALEQPETPLLLFMPYGESMLYVDVHGDRVVNEKSSYDRRTKIHFARDADGNDPNRLLVMVYDEAVASEPTAMFPTRWPVPPAGVAAPWVVRADTLAGLEEELRARLDRIAPRTGDVRLADGFGARLEETVARFNGFAETGVDADFARGQQPIEVDASGPRRPGNHPNATMYPLASSGPYYAIVLAAGTLDTKGGPRTDSVGRVLHPDGTPVPRLYGAGNCVASASGDSYWSGGNTLGLAVTFGYLAGRAVSQESPRTAASAPVGASA